MDLRHIEFPYGIYDGRPLEWFKRSEMKIDNRANLSAKGVAALDVRGAS